VIASASPVTTAPGQKVPPGKLKQQLRKLLRPGTKPKKWLTAIAPAPSTTPPVQPAP
jgi:hypothetical protein